MAVHTSVGGPVYASGGRKTKFRVPQIGAILDDLQVVNCVLTRTHTKEGNTGHAGKNRNLSVGGIKRNELWVDLKLSSIPVSFLLHALAPTLPQQYPTALGRVTYGAVGGRGEGSSFDRISS